MADFSDGNNGQPKVSEAAEQNPQPNMSEAHESESNGELAPTLNAMPREELVALVLQLTDEKTTLKANFKKLKTKIIQTSNLVCLYKKAKENLSKAETHVNNLKQQLSAKTESSRREIGELQSALARSKDETKALQSTLEQMLTNGTSSGRSSTGSQNVSKELEDARATIRAKDSLISQLNSQITNMKGEVSSMQQYSHLKKDNSKLKRDLQAKDKAVDSLKTKVDTLQNSIKQLEQACAQGEEAKKQVQTLSKQLALLEDRKTKPKQKPRKSPLSENDVKQLQKRLKEKEFQINEYSRKLPEREDIKHIGAHGTTSDGGRAKPATNTKDMEKLPAKRSLPESKDIELRPAKRGRWKNTVSSSTQNEAQPIVLHHHDLARVCEDGLVNFYNKCNSERTLFGQEAQLSDSSTLLHLQAFIENMSVAVPAQLPNTTLDGHIQLVHGVHAALVTISTRDSEHLLRFGRFAKNNWLVYSLWNMASIIAARYCRKTSSVVDSLVEHLSSCVILCYNPSMEPSAAVITPTEALGFTSVFTGLCRITSNPDRVRIFVYDLLRHVPYASAPVLQSITCTWPKILDSRHCLLLTTSQLLIDHVCHNSSSKQGLHDIVLDLLQQLKCNLQHNNHNPPSLREIASHPSETVILHDFNLPETCQLCKDTQGHLIKALEAVAVYVEWNFMCDSLHNVLWPLLEKRPAAQIVRLIGTLYNAACTKQELSLVDGGTETSVFKAMMDELKHMLDGNNKMPPDMGLAEAAANKVPLDIGLAIESANKVPPDIKLAIESSNKVPPDIELDIAVSNKVPPDIDMELALAAAVALAEIVVASPKLMREQVELIQRWFKRVERLESNPDSARTKFGSLLPQNLPDSLRLVLSLNPVVIDNVSIKQRF